MRPSIIAGFVDQPDIISVNDARNWNADRSHISIYD